MCVCLRNAPQKGEDEHEARPKARALDEEARDETERVDEENGGHERESASNVAVRLRPGSADGDVVSIGDDELNACLGRHPVCDGGQIKQKCRGARVDRLDDRAGGRMHL